MHIERVRSDRCQVMHLGGITVGVSEPR